jgi:hypothetical protein
VPSHRRRFIYYFNASPGGNWASCRQKALHLMSVFDLRVCFYYQQVVFQMVRFQASTPTHTHTHDHTIKFVLVGGGGQQRIQH